MSALAPLEDHGVGAACVPGVRTRLADGVTRVTAPNPSFMTGPGTNTYVLGDDELVVVDPGPSLPAHLDVLIEEIAGRPVAAVAVTHHHRDHAPAARALADAVGAPVAGYGHDELAVDLVLTEGSTLSAGPHRVEAWHTPGHASDHLCFWVAPLGWLLTGDHLMEGSTVVIRPPDGDLTAYLASLARVRDAPGVTALAPGHGRLITDPSRAAADVLAHRAARVSIVLAALREHGPATAGGLRPYAYADVGADRDVVATATCWAHLLALVDEGLATSVASRDDPAAVFEATGAR